MKAWLSSGFIARLNRQMDAGLFVHAAVLEENESTTHYWVDAQREIIFDGHVYQPRALSIEGVDLTAKMTLPAVRLTVPNLASEVTDYLEEIDVLGQPMTVQLFHLDLLDIATDLDSMRLEIMAILGILEIVTFTLGLDLSLDDMVPRGVISRKEFPGIPSGMRRASVL